MSAFPLPLTLKKLSKWHNKLLYQQIYLDTARLCFHERGSPSQTGLQGHQIELPKPTSLVIIMYNLTINFL